jgi:uncharacterized delta-60 repeat protein
MPRALPSAFLILVLALACAHAGTPAGAATSGTVVGATVPSATSMSVAGCAPGVPGRTWFGTVLPGSTSIGTSDCTVTFGSSNDTSMLRIAQQDRSGAAMHSFGAERDTGYGTNGTVAVDIDPDADVETWSTILPDPATGATYVVGYADDASDDVDGVVVRIDATGTPDASWGTNGVLRVDLGADEEFHGGMLDPDGSGLVLWGGRNTASFVGDMIVVRLTAAGALDPSFGGGSGYETIDTTAFESLDQLQPRRDGAGWYGIRTHADAGVWHTSILRFDGSFALDPTFGTAGIAEIPSSRDLSCGSLLELEDGSLACAGSLSVSATRQDAIVARVRRDGTMDTSFSGDGVESYSIGVTNAQDAFNSLRPEADGGFVLSGFADLAPPAFYQPVVVRLDASFALDTSFAGTGWTIQPVDAPYDGGLLGDAFPAPDGDGYLVHGGAASIADNEIRPLLGRIDDDGSWSDVEFAPSGQVVVDAVIAATTSELSVIGSYGIDGRTLVGSITTDAGGEQVLDVTRFAAATIPDYQLGVQDWDDGAGAFGACLTGTTSATASWTTGGCAGTDSTAWHAVPADASSAQAKVAQTASGQASASAGLRFGLRVPTSQQPGLYVAPIDFVVLAPAA